ncbi:hypothetical protein VLK31_32135 [Variovorax sp. H27-G14]|uniref:hypothetical protein n=1 Tax=Variovorax sp. H27-G14 TaxID=3111914 RepID=UPI0038FCE2F6
MATPNISRPSTSKNSAGGAAADPAADPAGEPTDPWTVLEEKSTQLHSLLCYCHGNGAPGQEDAGPVHRDNVFWLASELAREVMELIQRCAQQKR